MKSNNTKYLPISNVIGVLETSYVLAYRLQKPPVAIEKGGERGQGANNSTQPPFITIEQQLSVACARYWLVLINAPLVWQELKTPDVSIDRIRSFHPTPLPPSVSSTPLPSANLYFWQVNFTRGCNTN